MASKAAPTCNHVKSNGRFCGSPALANDAYCYYHRSSRERTKRQLRHARRHKPLQLPLLEDRESIQIAIGDVLNAILADRIDTRKAGLLLYGLQTAASNARDLDLELTSFDEQIAEYTEIEQDSLQEEIDQEIAQEAQPEAADVRVPHPSQREGGPGDCPSPEATSDVAPAAQVAPAKPAAMSRKSKSALPKKKPAARVSNKQLWDVVGAAARQNAKAAANEVRKQIEKDA